MAESLRGHEFTRAQRDLVTLERDPPRLDRPRVRFSDSPQPYASNPSGTTAPFENPVAFSEEQQRRRELRRWQLINESKHSLPYRQYDAHASKESERLWDADPITSGRRPVPMRAFYTQAHKNIKTRWMEQGIWNDKWNSVAAGVWKHQVPLELESESETDSEAESPIRPYRFPPPPPRPKLRRPKSDDEKRQIAERLVVRERQREASRPYHQFIYQISREREQIEAQFRDGESTGIADINTRAYENIKDIWVQWKIWNSKWGILPGMSWKHEEPIEEDTADSPVEHAQPPISNGEAWTDPPIFSSAAYERSQIRESSNTNGSQQGTTSVDVDPAAMKNSDTEHTQSASTPGHTRTDKQTLHPTPGQTPRRSNRRPGEKPRPVANESLAPAKSAKVSKPARKPRLGPRQQRPARLSNPVP